MYWEVTTMVQMMQILFNGESKWMETAIKILKEADLTQVGSLMKSFSVEQRELLVT